MTILEGFHCIAVSMVIDRIVYISILAFITCCVTVISCIVHVQGEGWFGEDGQLLYQPNPLKKIHARQMLLQHEGTEHVEPRKVCGVCGLMCECVCVCVCVWACVSLVQYTPV